METPVTFICQGLELEGRLASASTAKCAVITHPHPLFGGDMDNIVVRTIAEAYQQKGWSTLRFNFRGTGASQGRFDDGKGEQMDIEAAVTHLKVQGFQTIELAGYSFGAWVLARWSQEQPDLPRTIRLIAPPVAFLDFTDIRRIPGLTQVAVGSGDDFAPSGQVATCMPVWHPEADFNIIPRGDHFFSGQLETLKEVLSRRIA